MKLSNATQAVIEVMNSGKMPEDELEQLSKICNLARERVRAQAVKKLSVDDKVTVNTGRKSDRGIPKHVTGIITKTMRTRVTVDCGEYGPLTLPVGSVSLIE